MSWPHILSFSRVLAGPAVAALILSTPGDSYLFAGVIFGVASLTDLADGKLARHGKRESPLGVFLDTTSDKILVSLTLVAMAVGGLIAAWIALVIVGREFLISGLRSYAASCDRVVSAHAWGKGKAAVTMLGIGCLLFVMSGYSGGSLAQLGTHGAWASALTGTRWLLGFATVLTVVSGARYVIDAWPLLRPQTDTDQSAILEAPRPRAVGER